MTAQSANYKWNDLEKSSSPWRVTLLDALGHELQAEPIKIEKLPEAIRARVLSGQDAVLEDLQRALRRAAATSDFAGIKSGSLTLRIASPVGRVELTWRT